MPFVIQPILKYSNEIRSAVLIAHGEKAHSYYFGKSLIVITTDKNDVQLSFITHDAMLPDLKFFRGDQIWFAENNDATCAAELYSLASFTPLKG